MASLSQKIFQKVFSKKYFENNKILHKSILKIPNKILFCIFKIKYYFQNTILHMHIKIEIIITTSTVWRGPMLKLICEANIHLAMAMQWK